MFTLWYSVLSWKEYRETIWEKLGTKSTSNSVSNNTDVLTTKPQSKIPIIEQPKYKPVSPEPQRIPKTPSPQHFTPSPSPSKSPFSQFSSPQSPKSPISPSPSPKLPISPSPSAQISKSPSPQPPKIPSPLQPPSKPPRSPSPHPMRADAFDDIEYEEETDEEDEDEDSIIDSNSLLKNFEDVRKPVPVRNSVNEFINQEIVHQKIAFDDAR